MSQLKEHITKALHDADFMKENIRNAYTSTEENRLAEIILMDLMKESMDLHQKISRLADAIND